MMPVEFLGVALKEQDDSADYYEAQRPGLGLEFLAEVERTLDRIRRFPLIWVKVSARSHRCQLNRFPYGLIFQVRADKILILAVMHLRRKPGYWSRRERP